ncbi:MAG TPA: hypothetical protein VHC49_06740 [Mycobacteriales bacterium]|nr:hypothetical protein [Mycobacteriales bacterium]
MIDALSLAIAVTCLGGSAAALISGVTQRFRWRTMAPTLVLLEIALVGQAVADVLGLARGHRPGELATHLAYLSTSLVILPVAAVQSGGEDGRWPSLLIAVALLTLAVLVVRLQTTWRS